MEFLVVLAAGTVLFFVIGTVLTYFGLIDASDPDPCDCDECHRARRDPFRPY